jgi:general secretion pathway protein H
MRVAGNRGFTLIETLVVLLILGLGLSIVAGFANRGHAGLDLASASDELSSALRHARMRAIATQTPMTLTADATGHGYRLDGQVHLLPPSLRLSLEATQAIRFSPDGSSSGGSVRIQRDGAVRHVRVNWLTGRVTTTAEER